MSTEPTPSPRILVGFDGSESVLDAVALGRRLAEDAGGGLIVAYITPLNVTFVPYLEQDPVVERSLREAAEDVLSEAEPALEGFEAWALKSVRREHNAHADALVNQALDAARD